MKLVREDARFVVYDDLLPAADFARLWNWLQNTHYTLPIEHGWNKVWRLGDAYPLQSVPFVPGKQPLPPPLQPATAAFDDLARRHHDLLGEWTELRLRCWLYPRGSRLSWHADGWTYSGALAYYVHPRWSASWGGELFVADLPDGRSPYEDSGAHLDHAAEDAYLLERGTGTYIAPKPNRLVLLRGGALHMLARVDPDAGDHARASISGFFQRPKPPIDPALLHAAQQAGMETTFHA